MPPIERRRLVGLPLGLAVGVAAGLAAGLTGMPQPARAQADPAVLAPVRALIAGLLTIMKQGRAVAFAQRAATLAPVVSLAFDLDTILRESVGLAWSGLPAEQQNALRQAFSAYTVASYAHSFDALDGQRFDILPDTRAAGDGLQVVRTRIVSRDGDTHALDYVMRSTAAGWRIVDVLADGTISRVAVQRADFRRLLNQGGAAALIDSLRAKARDLANP